ESIHQTNDIYKLHLEQQILDKLNELNIQNLAQNIKNNQEFIILLKTKLAQYEKEQELKFKDLKELILSVENNEQKSKELLNQNQKTLEQLQNLKMELLNAK
ncbi:hypothetical protein, partial [Campylobacter volucris]